METLDLINEIQTDSRNGWLRILMHKDKCIYAGCRRVIKVIYRETFLASNVSKVTFVC